VSDGSRPPARATPHAALRLALLEEEALRTALFESSADCVKLLEPDGRITAVNRAGVRLMGAPDESAMLLRSWLDCWDDEGRPRAADALATARGGAVVRFQATAVTFDGTRRWLDTTLTPVRGTDGAVARLVLVARDLTELRDAIAAGQASASRLAGIVGSAMDAIVTVDAAQRIVLVNRAAEHVFGWTAAELLGEPLDLLIPDALRSVHRAHVERFGRERAPVRAMGRPRDHAGPGLTGRRRDGTVFPIEASISHVESGGEHFFTVILRDVTDRLEAERARADAEHRLRESEARAWMLFRDGPLPKWVFDVDTLRILDVNEAALRTYGYTREEFLALTILDLRPPEERAALAARRPTFEEGYAQLGRFRHMRRSGERFDVEIVRHDTVFDGRRARVVVAIDITQRLAAERALRDSEERYALALRAVSDVLWDRDLATGHTTVLGGGLAPLGLTPEEVAHDWTAWTTRIHPADAPAVARSFRTAIAGGRDVTEWQHEYRVRRPDGTWRRIADRAVIVRDDATGRATRVIGAAKDVTVERDLADRLRQAQKMEAIGQLAGGVAHDFNNLLTVIGVNLELAEEDLATGGDVRPLFDEIQLATRQASTLVRQLLTFSRRAEVRPADVSLADAVRGAERLLRRVIGEEITLDVATTPGEVTVHADAGEIEQVLMNLVVNARDAMLTPLHGHPGRGGTLTIEVEAVALPSEARVEWPGPPPACVARLRVRDTGHGMDEGTRRRIFEPFFTTKEVGRGTGIGLATVFGIVARAGGVTVVQSAPGAGTTFDVLLPLATAAPPATAPTTPRARTPTRQATVLLFEDESAVRAAARRMLERRGYAVLEARHGADALDVWQAHGAHIAAIVTDVRMPEMGGPELVARLRADGATVPVVYLTGYAEHPVVASPEARERIVGKPFDSTTLADALDAVLAEG
jgi:PAS domain S-box-containing protein